MVIICLSNSYLFRFGKHIAIILTVTWLGNWQQVWVQVWPWPIIVYVLCVVGEEGHEIVNHGYRRKSGCRFVWVSSGIPDTPSPFVSYITLQGSFISSVSIQNRFVLQLKIRMNKIEATIYTPIMISSTLYFLTKNEFICRILAYNIELIVDHVNLFN